LENNVTKFKKVSAFKYEKEILSLITSMFNKQLDLQKGIPEKYKRIMYSLGVCIYHIGYFSTVISNHS
jgi:hypothetical protein